MIAWQWQTSPGSVSVAGNCSESEIAETGVKPKRGRFGAAAWRVGLGCEKSRAVDWQPGVECVR